MTLPRSGIPVSGLPSCLILGMVLSLSAIYSPAMSWDREGAEKALVKARACRDQLVAARDAAKGQFLDCINLYQSVYRLDPHYGGSDDAVYEEGQLLELLGERSADAAFLGRAARIYQVLVSQYPASPKCPEALLHLLDLYSGPLKDPAAAAAAENVLKTTYRSSAAAAATRKRTRVAPEPKPQPTAAPPTASEPARPPGGPPAAVQNIRYWSTKDYTRVIIDLDGETSYQKTRIRNPERVFFDINNSKVTSDLFNKKFNVSDEFLHQIRVAQNRADLVRVVLDFAAATDCIVTEMHNPFRIVIDVHGTKGVPPRVEQLASQTAAPPEDPFRALRDSQAAPSLNAGRPSRLPEPKPLRGVAEAVASPTSPVMNAKLRIEPVRTETRVDEGSSSSSAVRGEPAATDPPAPPGKEAAVAAFVSSPPVPISPSTTSTGKLDAPSQGMSAPKEPVHGNPASRSADVPSPPVVSPGVDVMPRPASPTSVGNRTMTRMLGLKIGRIVIDPGHGGHDTGTIGRGGLREKDVVLEVALQLRRLLEDKMGAEVILTREADVFIPLEERTAIANDRKADLFVSIHANSASNKNTSGVETYYLNFARSAQDREIAARENATSARNIHELQDLVKKIAQAEKSAESRELAAILQKKLFAGAQQLFPSARNRGVRSAPFVVLIGAHMPSVLAEVAFISNPRDERLLRKQDSAQRVARALFSGIEGYTKTLGGDVAQTQSQSK